MCNKNSFCGGCGSPVFDGKAVCRSCVSCIHERGFVSIEHFDDWSETEFSRLEASEFDCEIATQLGESVEAVVQHGFQPTDFETESGFEEVDWVFLAERKAWHKQFREWAWFEGNLGA